MSVSPEVLRTHLAYTAWASGRLLEVAGRLSPEELTRDFQTADHSVLGTLVHTFAGDRIWLARLTNAPAAPFRTESDNSLTVLQNDWPALLDRWQQWALGISDETAGAPVAYKDTRGNAYQQPLWQLILHVVNHGTHHRGQVSGFLRAMGHVPPPLDLAAYYREQAAHA